MDNWTRRLKLSSSHCVYFLNISQKSAHVSFSWKIIEDKNSNDFYEHLSNIVRNSNLFLFWGYG